MKKLIVALAACASLTGCILDDVIGTQPAPALVAASTPRGGVVRFTGPLVGEAVIVAQRHCFDLDMHAVPLGFFPSGAEQLMTFQCTK